MFNIYGIIMLVLIMIPNIVYFQKNKDIDVKKMRESSSLEITENILRYMVILFFAVNTGLFEYGFADKKLIAVWAIASAVLIAVYYAGWVKYFKCKTFAVEILLAVVPSIVFIFSGIMMRCYVALVLSVLFGIVHVYTTYKNKI